MWKHFIMPSKYETLFGHSVQTLKVWIVWTKQSFLLARHGEVLSLKPNFENYVSGNPQLSSYDKRIRQIAIFSAFHEIARFETLLQQLYFTSPWDAHGMSRVAFKRGITTFIISHFSKTSGRAFSLVFSGRSRQRINRHHPIPAWDKMRIGKF